MTFLQFFLYFLGSEVLISAINMIVSFVRGYIANRKLKKMVDMGQIKILTKEEFMEMMAKEEKKTWN